MTPDERKGWNAAIERAAEEVKRKRAEWLIAGIPVSYEQVIRQLSKPEPEA